MKRPTQLNTKPGGGVPAIRARRVGLAAEAVVAAYISDLAAGAALTGATPTRFGRPAPATGSLRLRDGHAVRVGSRDRRQASRARASRGDAFRPARATS
jgi:hypothetical protein